MDAISVCLTIFIFSAVSVCSTGLSMTITTSAVTARRNQDVTVTCTIQDAEGLQSTVYIYLGTFYFRAAYFYQRATGCEPRSTDDRVPISLTTVCGSGTNSSESSSKEYILTTRPRKVLTNYYRGTSFRGSTYFSNAVTFSLLSEVDCASINISGGGDVLTVTQGTEFDGITCSTGGANPEPEVKLKLKLDETSSADLPARKLASARTMEFERTLCNPLEFETYSSRTTARLAFVPDRHHDGKYVYCSAKNSEMGINDEVTSNEIRLIVQYGPSGNDITFNPNAVFHTVRESGSLTVTCSAKCSPVCSYTWSYLDKIISNNNRLALSDISREEAGFYKCTVRNPGSGHTAEQVIILRVKYDTLSTAAAIAIGVAVGVVVTFVIGIICYVVRRRTEDQSARVVKI